MAAECAAPQWTPHVTPQKKPQDTCIASRHGFNDEENSSGVQNSSPSTASNSDDLLDDAKERKKKHSGPRKRRPKKKSDPASAASNSKLLTSPILQPLVAAGHVASVPAMADEDLATLLQTGLALKNVELALKVDGQEAGTATQLRRSPTSPYSARNPYGAAGEQQQRQRPMRDGEGMELALAARTHPRESFSPHQRRPHPPYHHHAALQYQQQLQPGTAAYLEYGDQYQYDRSYWTKWVIEAAEKERARRLNVLRQLQQEEEEEIQRRRKWAIAAIEREQEAMMREMFLDNMKNTQWFQSTISRFAEDYEVVCPNSWFGCMYSCMLKDLESHLESCVYRQVPDTLDQAREDSLGMDFYTYDVVCPNAVLGCNEICSRENLAVHLASCPVNGISREKEWEERLEGRRNVILATEEERARRMSEQQQQSNSDDRFSFGHLQRLYEEQTAMMQVVLHDEIMDFYEHQEHEALQLRPWITQAISKVKSAIQDLWGSEIQVEGYGSFATQLHSGHSDVDLVVFGVTEENKMSCQQCVGALAAHFAAQNSTDFIEISAITRASIPLLKVVVIVNVMSSESDSGERVLRVPFDITFDDPVGLLHNGIASAALISTLSDHFYGLRELAFVLKHFLAKRGLNDPYVGGLSSYGLLLMIIFILLEQGALVSSVAQGEECGQAQASAPLQAEPCDLETRECSNGAFNPRYEAQREKGEQIAQEIIKQSITRQQLKQDASSGDSNTAKRRKMRRPHLPSLLVDEDESEHDAKPYLLGKYLMDFLQFYGNDFRQNVDIIVILGLDPSEIELLATAPSPGSGRSSSASVSPPSSALVMSPPPTLRAPPPSIACPPLSSSSFSPLMSPASPPSQEGFLLIRDPLQPENNVGKTCYRVSQVCRDFSDFLSFLTALIVRGSVMTTGKKKKSRARNESDPAFHPDQPPRNPSHRILTSVFEMKTRDTRASMDLTNSS